MGRKLDGSVAAAKTVRRKRALLNEVLNTAVEIGYFSENPLNGLRWKAPAVNEEVDPAVVPNPSQVLRLLDAVATQPGRGPHLEAFFGCMYFAAMRPAEVIHLRIDQCHLPKTGWGMLNLSGGVVIAGKGWSDDGKVYEVHSLNRRAATATRPVPIPPQFVNMLGARVERFGTAPDGRIFRNQAGNYVDATAYGITWARAREYGLTRVERASRLAKRPYDLRHAGISFWLYSGVDPAECARRAGQSIEVLFRHYAKFLDGLQERANQLIEQSMHEWQRTSRTGTPEA
jgi:integrase